MTRDAAGATGLAMPAIRAGRLAPGDMKRLFAAAAGRAEMPLLLDSRGGLTVAQIASAARRAVREHGVRLIVIDYLQCIRADDRYRGNKVNEVAEITFALKALAKELALPVVLLSQLSRAVEGRDNKRPQLSDLRDSGAIEQDADAVLFLYRDAYYLERAGAPKRNHCRDADDWQDKLAAHNAAVEASHGKADIIVAKQRNGPCRSIEVAFDALRMRFADLADNPSESNAP